MYRKNPFYVEHQFEEEVDVHTLCKPGLFILKEHCQGKWSWKKLLGMKQNRNALIEVRATVK
jgi:hypothetical protein